MIDAEKASAAHVAEFPAWFARAAEGLRPRRRAWLRPLPVVVLRSGEILPASAAGWVLAAAAFVEAEAALHDLFDELRRRAEPGSLDAWTAGALGAWTGAGSPPRDACLLEAAGRFGGDATVRVLCECVRRWTRDKERVLALRGIDTLGRIGSKAALEEAATLAAGFHDRGVATEARQLVATKALPDGETPEEAEDRHVADCGLDGRGERLFSYGPRSFCAAVDGGLRLALFDADGQRRMTLPPPASTDDRALAVAARAAWSELKTAYPRVLRAQTRRFEAAMVSGRAWMPEQFRHVVLAHPLLSRLARLLVWQAAGPFGRSFRVTEDLTLADAADETVPWDDTPLRVAHPLSLAPDERRAWTDLFAEYRLTQPFQQLLRAVHTFDPALAHATALPAPAHPPISPPVLFGVLRNDDWLLGPTGDTGIATAWKFFAADGVRAMLAFTGFYPQAMSRSPAQTISHAGFFAGLTRAPRELAAGRPLPLGTVPAVAFSETARRLERLTAST